jgi:DNA-binding phage protein
MRNIIAYNLSQPQRPGSRQGYYRHGDIAMPLTRDFKKTVLARTVSDPAFRDELLRESVECLISGELEIGKAILRDYINATKGFEKLGGVTNKSTKNLMRMLGPKGNPQARNLFEVLALLKKTGGLRLKLALKRR